MFEFFMCQPACMWLCDAVRSTWRSPSDICLLVMTWFLTRKFRQSSVRTGNETEYAGWRSSRTRSLTTGGGNWHCFCLNLLIPWTLIFFRCNNFNSEVDAFASPGLSLMAVGSAMIDMFCTSAILLAADFLFSQTVSFLV